MAQQVERPTRPMPRSMTSALLLVVVGVAVMYCAKGASDWYRSRRLRELAEYALVQGETSAMPAPIANLFSIPNDGQPVTFRSIQAGTHDGRVHSALVRKRPGSGHVDVILLDTASDGAAYHYLTSTDGRLIKAIHSDTQIHQVPDSKDRFEAEVKSWLQFLKTLSTEKAVL